MFRPPAREMCLNTVEDVYQTCKNSLFLLTIGMIFLTHPTDEESRPAATKVLTKWRPQSAVLETTTNGAPEPSATPSQPEAQPAVASEQ